MTSIRFEHVDVVFGTKPRAALDLLDRGGTRDEIKEATGHVVGVRDATLDVRPGQICVLMGLSGSGKSTLLRCVNGLNRATRGRVLVTGADGETTDVARCSSRRLRRVRQREIAMVFQAFALLPWRTVAENVGFGLELSGVDKVERARIVAEKLELVDLEDWADKYAHELSGGMQQRVGLARALASDAPILLMDEPFSALDPLIRDRLQNELLDLQERLKKTILFVSHDLDEAMKLGNRIAIMESGAIIQEGDPETIVTEPANDYVAAFVGNLNPLNVLTAGSIMAPLDVLPEGDGGVVLDRYGRVRVHFANDGRVRDAFLDDAPIRSVPFTENPERHVLVRVHPETSLRQVVELRRKSGCPVLVEGDDQRIVGKVGEMQIYDGVLKQLRRQPPVGW